MIYGLYAISVLAALIILIVVIAALRPSKFQIVRSLLIAATPAQLFPYINNLRKFQEWSPFKDKDPNASNEFSGPEQGPRAVFRWSGNKNAGEGIMTIVKCVPDSTVDVNLEFLRPFAGKSSVEFSLIPQTGGTVVTWKLMGTNALFPRIIGMFINMDKMIGSEFENGLSRLKKLME